MTTLPPGQETQRFRAATGGRVDRNRSISFTFDGRHLTGHDGDTLASALLANGIHLVARSFKYHRPRGILSAGPEEPNALVTIRRGWRRVTPNLKATEVELYDGLVAESQNRWPSLHADLGSLNDRLAPLFPAGFYYKTFMGRRSANGNKAWVKYFEPAIRRMAGLGRAPRDADPDRYASRFAHCDVLVVGAGPAGLAAALAASAAGASVIVCDEQPEPGGTLLSRDDAVIDGKSAADWLTATVATLSQRKTVRLLRRTTAFGCYPDRMFGLLERLSDHLGDPPQGLPRERLWQVRAREIVLATGAIERPVVFPGNDRPGIMLAHAAETYLKRFGVLAGTRAVIVTESDEAYRLAADLVAHAIAVERIIDLRLAANDHAREAARRAGIAVTTGGTVLDTGGRARVDMVSLAHADGAIERIGVDLLLMAGGFTPTLHLFSQMRGQLQWNEAAGALTPASPLSHVQVVGAASAERSLARSLADATEAGIAAAEAAGKTLADRPRAPNVEAAHVDTDHTGRQTHAVALRKAGRAFVDFQNDVTAKDLELATREGFTSIEHLKRYTTTGMATDQGKTSNVNALGLLADVLGKDMASVGHTTFRPPYTPVSFGALAAEARGTLFDPIRRTPIDAWARARGAIFEDVGQWQRARYFPGHGEDMTAAVARECRAVRQAVGIFDGSTLGKIEVTGTNAAAFLDRMYPNAIASLPVGRCRYAIMLNEAGFVIDDGIVARIAPDRFHVTTTTGGAAHVLAHMEDYRQTEFTDLECWLTSTTEHWAVIALQGPKAREILAPLLPDIDLSDRALPHMACLEGQLSGVPIRLFRVSFTGETGYEINVPAGHARQAWDALAAAVEANGGAPYGTEAMHVLRAEKGYIIVGQETDGTVTPRDLGLPEGKTKADFVGKRGLARPDLIGPDRYELVGLECEDGNRPLEEGAQIASVAEPATGAPALGHVTSAYASPTLDRPIALALVRNARQRLGQTLYVPMPDGGRRVRLVPPVFYDPTGGKLRG